MKRRSTFIMWQNVAANHVYQVYLDDQPVLYTEQHHRLAGQQLVLIFGFAVDTGLEVVVGEIIFILDQLFTRLPW